MFKLFKKIEPVVWVGAAYGTLFASGVYLQIVESNEIDELSKKHKLLLMEAEKKYPGFTKDYEMLAYKIKNDGIAFHEMEQFIKAKYPNVTVTKKSIYRHTGRVGYWENKLYITAIPSSLSATLVKP